MRRFNWLAATSVILTLNLVACAPSREEAADTAPVAPRGQSCDTASANVTTFDRATAQVRAEAALEHQIADLQGEMFSTGVRRLRAVNRTSDCVIAGPVGGMFRCTAAAQVCGY